MAKKSKGDKIAGISPFANRDWQAESDLDTLIRAEEIEKDAKRFAAAKKVAKQRLEATQAVLAEKK